MMGRTGALAEPLFDKIRGKRVGVIAGSDHERMLRAYFPAATVVALPTQEALYGALKASQIDAAFGDGMRFAFWLAGADASGCCRFAGGPYLAPEHLGQGLAIAVPAERPELAQALDYALHEIAVKGTFAELYLRYFPVGFF
jgi:polar amino acid transport system substrate-binding protein